MAITPGKRHEFVFTGETTRAVRAMQREDWAQAMSALEIRDNRLDTYVNELVRRAAAKRWQSTTQTAPTVNVFTDVTLSSVEFATHPSMTATAGQIIVPFPGVYRVEGRVLFNNPAAATAVRARLLKNNAGIIGGTEQVWAATLNHTIHAHASTIVVAEKDDFFELQAWHNNSVASIGNADGNFVNFLAVHRVA